LILLGGLEIKIEINYFWGILGFLGLLGYVLENPVYYTFFAFFLLLLVPILNEKLGTENTTKKEEYKTGTSNDLNRYDFYNVSIWLGSAALIVDSLVLIIWKTMNDALAIGLLLGVMVFMTNFFSYIGIEKSTQDERIRKIGTLSTTYSWYVTIVFVSFLLITSYWSGVVRTGTELLGVTIFVMVTTMIGTNTYMKLKGDIE
jgi:hypothetical protein